MKDTTNNLHNNMSGSVVLITGASRGLGRAAAVRFLELGARVAVNVRTRERANAVATELGEQAFGVGGDITSSAAIGSIVAQTIEKFGRLDVLVNNAALAPATRFEQIPEQEWRDTIDVNLTAPFLLTRAVVPQMKLQQYGRIVNISSLAGQSVSTVGGAHYTASKAGLQGLTRASARELGPYGITVNAVCPGLFDTEMARENATMELLESHFKNFPVKRLGTPAELAELICFLSSEAAGYITGASIDINGGSLML